MKMNVSVKLHPDPISRFKLLIDHRCK